MTRRPPTLLRALALAGAALMPAGRDARAREFPGLTMEGPTGLVLCPTGQVVRADWFALGMTQGVAKASYGLLGAAEAGFSTPDLLENPSRDDWLEQLSGFVKVGGSPLPASWWCPGLALGVERRGVLTATPTGYACASWAPAVGGWLLEAVAGAGSGRFLNEPFGGVAVVPPSLFNRSMKFMCEYAGHRAEAGARLALSRNLRMDVVVLLHALPPGSRPGRRGWLITLDQGLPGASWTGDTGLSGFLSRVTRRLFGPRSAPPPAPGAA